MEYFTPSWRRPRRKNDVVSPPCDGGGKDGDDAAGSEAQTPSIRPFWRRYPCLVCGKLPRSTSGAAQRHKRCGRCHSAVYCSRECQRQDYVEGKHKSACAALSKLWEEKDRLEGCMWKSKTVSTNPFDDEVYDYPEVGKFWHDRPRTALEKVTTNYCVVLLQLVQLLGRGESWRVSRIEPGRQDSGTGRRGVGNPLSRELAIDIAYRLLHLDRTDMRVRLLVPSLLLEGKYYQEAYGFLKHWLHVDRSLMIMDLALMGGSEDEVAAKDIAPEIPDGGEDICEPPDKWMDGEMIYPSIGMAFELAFLKCHLLCSLKSGQFRAGSSGVHPYAAFGTEEIAGTEPVGLAEKCVDTGEEELERQVKLLLSVVHKWNPHLLPNLAGSYETDTGTLSGRVAPAAEEGVTMPPTPPGLAELLKKQPPGFDLQYKMGNAGGQSLDEAVSIWQKDVILWHVMDPRAMKFLSEFCSSLDENLVDTNCLDGGAKSSSEKDPGSIVGNIQHQSNAENSFKRREAEELVAKLQKENPKRTMDEIMMHPEMAQLMIKHLHTE